MTLMSFQHSDFLCMSSYTWTVMCAWDSWTHKQPKPICQNGYRCIHHGQEDCQRSPLGEGDFLPLFLQKTSGETMGLRTSAPAILPQQIREAPCWVLQLCSPTWGIGSGGESLFQSHCSSWAAPSLSFPPPSQNVFVCLKKPHYHPVVLLFSAATDHPLPHGKT